MVKIILSGCSGTMGKVIASIVRDRNDCEIVAGIDIVTEMYDNFPIFSSIDNFTGDADVIIDFSNPALLDSLLTYSKTRKIPVVLATTGFSREQIAQINKACEETAIFFTYNMSLGVNLLVELAKKATCVLGDSFDIEIIEKHHNQKIDAPSGTALMIADAINDTMDNSLTYSYDRHSVRKKRDKNELGIHAVRGGTIVGEHEVIFAGRDEILTISHSAMSKEIFAVGSVNAALFLKDKKVGIYSMSDVVKL